MPNQDEINADFERRIKTLERQASGTDTAGVRHKPWYKSFGVWLALILTLAMLYCIYLLYMKGTGHVINIFGLIRF